MANKKVTRRALGMSIISLILCCAMLVGTTFAWFTDEVVSGMNNIQAGNLDVKLMNDGIEVDSNTKLFDNITLWEPGMVAYENLQVVNAGTLALKYQMTLSFGNENDLNGHKLSEVLKVAVIDKIADGATRETVLAAAEAAVAADQGNGSLSNFYVTGSLEAGASSDEQTIVIFWSPNDNTTDNLYNANNGQITSDGEPLHIEFGVNLQATQEMNESDSFDNEYDKFSSILPKATVNNTGAKTVPVYMGYDADKLKLDTSFQFLPNETQAEAQSSAYRYWHADYVIKADKDVPADSIALAGYYQAWCGENGWVVMTSSDTISAGTEIRLVDALGATVNYEEICQYGKDDVGFLCGAADLTGENAGTTITVELRLYETTVDPATGTGNKNDETGKYEVVGTYSYTFGAYEVSTADELAKVLTSEMENISVTLANDIDLPITSLGSQTAGSGEYKLGGDNTKSITIDLNGHKLNITTGYWSAIGAKNADATFTIKNGSMTSSQESGTWNSYDVTFANCNYVIEDVTFGKAIAFTNAGKSVKLEDIIVNETHDYYAIWITAEGQTVEIDGMTVNSAGRGIKIDEQYCDSTSKVTLKVSNASFNTEKKAAIMVKSAAGADITLDNVNISGVAADRVNAVWNDADAATYGNLISVTGGTMIQEA